MSTNKTILKRVAFWFRQRPVVCCRHEIAAVRKIHDRNSHQGNVTLRNFSTPHTVTLGVGSHEHVQMLVVTLKKRELIDRTARNAQGTWTRTIKRHAEQQRLVFLPAPGAGPN